MERRARLKRDSARWFRLCLLSAACALGGGGAQAEGASGEILGSGCTGCHGERGVSSGSALPSIAGLDPRYLMRVMNEFKNEERPATLMDRIAKGYSFRELRSIAAYFSELPWQSDWLVDESQDLTEAKKLHDERCEECHEKQGRHQDREVARIAGQSADYLFIQLQQYRAQEDKVRQPEKMQTAVADLTDGQLRTLAAFYSQQR